MPVCTAVGLLLGLPEWLSGKESACREGDIGSIPGTGGSPREGNDNLLQYSCLGNPTEEPGGLQSTEQQKSQDEIFVTEHTHTYTDLLSFLGALPSKL